MPFMAEPVAVPFTTGGAGKISCTAALSFGPSPPLTISHKVYTKTIPAEVPQYFGWIQKRFTAEPPRHDSGANFERNDPDSGPKVGVTGQKSELRTKSQSYSRADFQNQSQIAQRRPLNGV